MSRIRKVFHHSKEVLIIDYSDSKERDMIKSVIELRELIEQEKKPVLILSIFNDKSYVTPNFMRQTERETEKVIGLIEKQALTGLNDIKKMILKGYNLMFGRNIQNFNTIEEAITFLVDDTTTDKAERKKDLDF